jgi:sulfofructose kinase
MTAFDVVGLGVSTVDVVTLVDHFPRPEEVQRAAAMTVQGGGPVATAMVTLARLGASTAMVDVLGDDWRGALIRDEFQREGVSVEFIQQRRDCTSSTACIVTEQATAGRSIVYAPGTAPDLSPDDVPRAAIESCRFLHVNGRHWDACLHAVRIARSANVPVSFDGGAHRYRPELQDLVPFTDVCIVARQFAEEYTRTTAIPAAADILLSCGPGIVVITDGVRGSWVYSRGGTAFHQAAFVLPQVVDTTGCGDSYHGAFLFGLLKGMALEKTAEFASAVAALNSQGLGGRGGLPTLAQVESFLSGMGSGTRG